MAYVKTQWVNNTTAVNAANMNHIEDGIYTSSNNIDGLSASKVDKVSTQDELAAYIHNGDTQGIKIISNTPGEGILPMYNADGIIKTNAPSADTDCANKSYVDSATESYTENEIAELFGIS